METFSALLAICAGNSPVPGEFPAQTRVARSFDVFLDLHPNKRLSKQCWFETPSCPSCRHRNAVPGSWQKTVVKYFRESNTFRRALTALGNEFTLCDTMSAELGKAVWIIYNCPQFSHTNEVRNYKWNRVTKNITRSCHHAMSPESSTWSVQIIKLLSGNVASVTQPHGHGWDSSDGVISTVWCHNHELLKALWTPWSMAANLHLHVAQGGVGVDREICSAFICAITTQIAPTWTQLNVTRRIAIQINTLRPRPNGRYFADDTFKCIFLNENAWTSLKISLKFVPKVRINNIPALVQIMAWRRPGDKPLSEPMMVNLLTHIGVTRPQWAKWVAMQQSGHTQGVLECTKNSQKYFSLSVIMINVVKVNSKAVILALVEAHVSFLDMWCHKETQIWVNIRSYNGSLPEGTKPLSDAMSTYHQHCSVAFNWERFHKKYSWA